MSIWINYKGNIAEILFEGGNVNTLKKKIKVELPNNLKNFDVIDIKLQAHDKEERLREDIIIDKNFLTSYNKPIHVVIDADEHQEPPFKRFRPNEDFISTDDSLINFWNETLELKFSDDDKFLRLQQGTKFCGNHDAPSVLMVRKCYVDLRNCIINDERANNYVISGNPGIGKTLFAYYLICYLAQFGKPIVYTFKDKCIKFSSDGVWEGEFREDLRNKETWYIVDAKDPKHVNARTVLITSPNPNIGKDYRKNKIAHYMPVWSWEEIVDCHDEIYKSLLICDVKILFEEWGGIPRYVLECPYLELNHSDLDLEKLRKNLDHAIGLFSKDDFCEFTASKGECAADSFSHKIIQIIPDNNYLLGGYQFASKYVISKVAFNTTMSCTKRLKLFLKSSNEIGTLGTLRGYIFKQYAHMILSNGGTFNIRELVDKNQKISHNSGTLVLTKRKGQVFRNYNEIGNSDMYYCPYSMNNESIDSVILPNMIFQMTVSEKHKIKYNGLLEAKSIPGRNMKFYFVVPEDKYDSFIYKQEITVSDGQKTVMKWALDMKQYVLKIDLDINE